MPKRREITVRLTKPNSDWIDAMARDQSGMSANSYINDLVADDRKRRWQESVNEQLNASLNSGPARPWTRKDMQDVRAAVREAIARRQRRKSA